MERKVSKGIWEKIENNGKGGWDFGKIFIKVLHFHVSGYGTRNEIVRLGRGSYCSEWHRHIHDDKNYVTMSWMA